MKGKDLLEVCRRVVSNHQYEEIEIMPGSIIVLDVQTANMVCTVYDNLKKNKKNFEEFEAHSVLRKCLLVFSR